MSQLAEFEAIINDKPSLISEEFIKTYLSLRSAGLLRNEIAPPFPGELKKLSKTEYNPLMEDMVKSMKNGSYFGNLEIIGIEEFESYMTLQKRANLDPASEEPFLFTFFNKLYNPSTKSIQTSFYHGLVELNLNLEKIDLDIKQKSIEQFLYDGTREVFPSVKQIEKIIKSNMGAYIIHAINIQHLTNSDIFHTGLEKITIAQSPYSN